MRNGGGVLGRTCNSKRPLVFPYVVFTKKLGIYKARDIQARITRGVDLWERCLYAVLVGDADAEGAARRAESPVEERRNIRW